MSASAGCRCVVDPIPKACHSPIVVPTPSLFNPRRAKSFSVGSCLCLPYPAFTPFFWSPGRGRDTDVALARCGKAFLQQKSQKRSTFARGGFSEPASARRGTQEILMMYVMVGRRDYYLARSSHLSCSFL